VTKGTKVRSDSTRCGGMQGGARTVAIDHAGDGPGTGKSLGVETPRTRGAGGGPDRCRNPGFPFLGVRGDPPMAPAQAVEPTETI